jgi:predicted RNA methylase
MSFGLEGIPGRIGIDPDVQEVLRGIRVVGNVAYIDRPLERELYMRVNKVLEALGGKWNRKVRGHVFESDPSEALMRAVVQEEVVDPKKALGMFETPRDLAETMVLRADLRPGMRVLEPSAGRGAIADAVRAACPECRIETVEIDDKNRKVLKEKGYKIVGKDFMKFRPKGCYDRILMNPPFAKQQDIDHVMKAFRHLCPRGRLVAIMSAGAQFRANRKTLAFRALVEEKGVFEDLPPGSFAAEGTMVNAILLTLDKPVDESTVYMRYQDAGPDRWGRREFFLSWWDESTGSWKSQIFHADPKKTAERWKCKGFKVVEAS